MLWQNRLFCVGNGWKLEWKLKVDSQGRLILPADWREAEIGEDRELYVIKRKGYLKTVPKRRVDLTENFDKVDLGVENIGNWKEFQKKFYEAGA